MVIDPFAHPAPGGHHFHFRGQLNRALMDLQHTLLPLLVMAVPTTCRVCLSGGTSRFAPLIAFASAEAEYIEGGNRWVLASLTPQLDDLAPEQLLAGMRLDLLPAKMGRLLIHLIEAADRSGCGRHGPAFDLLREVYLRQHIDGRWSQDYPDQTLIRLGKEMIVLVRGEARARQWLANLRRFIEGCDVPYEQLVLRTVNVERHSATFGGFSIRSGSGMDELEFHLTESWWSDLSRRLAPLSGVSRETAINAAIIDWVRCVSPAVEWSDPIDFYANLQEIAGVHAVQPLPKYGRFARWLYNGRLQWERIRRRFRPKYREEC